MVTDKGVIAEVFKKIGMPTNPLCYDTAGDIQKAVLKAYFLGLSEGKSDTMMAPIHCDKTGHDSDIRKELEGKLNKDQWNELLDIVYNEVEQEFKMRRQKVKEWLEYILAYFVTPPIKGGITAGKLKWRGIKKRDVFDSFSHTIEVYQRRKKIGAYTINYEYYNPIKNGYKTTMQVPQDGE